MRWLFGSIVSPFKKGEIKLIDAFVRNLPLNQETLTRMQLSRVNLIYRDEEGREISLYRIKWFKLKWEEDELVPTNKPEEKVGQLEFKLVPRGELHTAEIWFVRGHIFSIKLSCVPRAIAKPQCFEITNVDVNTGAFL